MPLNGSIFGDHAWTRPGSLDEDQVPLFDGVPDWLPVFPNPLRNGPFQGYQFFATSYEHGNVAWFPTMPGPQFGRGFVALHASAFVIPASPFEFPQPVYPNQITVKLATPWLWPFIAFVPQVTPYTGDQALPIHVPDEAPVDVELRISVEYDVGGGSVPFDTPPDLRIYHIDETTGAQVIDLAYTTTTQYGVNPAYYLDWTPSAKGKYMIEVLGLYLTNVVVATQTLTIRPKFDPIALALSDILVARNGDV